MEDKDIIDLYWQRSPAAVDATAQQYGGYLAFIAGHILRSPPDAEECVNDAYLKAWQSIPPARPEKLQAYLGKITRNLAISRLRRRDAQKRGGDEVTLALGELEDCLPTVSSLEEDMEARELGLLIQDFLEGQPKQKRILFVQRYWYVMPVKEIAAANGLSRTNVTSILYRMRKELKARLDQEGYCYGQRKTV